MGVNLLSSPHLTEDRRKLTVISPTVIHDPFGKEELLLSPCKNGILPWISFHYKQASKQARAEGNAAATQWHEPHCRVVPQSKINICPWAQSSFIVRRSILLFLRWNGHEKRQTISSNLVALPPCHTPAIEIITHVTLNLNLKLLSNQALLFDFAAAAAPVGDTFVR